METTDSMAHKASIAAISTVVGLLIGSVPGFVVFGNMQTQVSVNTETMKELRLAVDELKELAAAQKELNKLLQRYFEEKTR